MKGRLPSRAQAGLPWKGGQGAASCILRWSPTLPTLGLTEGPTLWLKGAGPHLDALGAGPLWGLDSEIQDRSLGIQVREGHVESLCQPITSLYGPGSICC
jgi:hypothetical protein